MRAPVCILDSVVVLHCIVFDFSEGLRFETSGASGNGGGLERPLLLSLPIDLAPCLVPTRTHVSSLWGPCRLVEFFGSSVTVETGTSPESLWWTPGSCPGFEWDWVWTSLCWPQILTDSEVRSWESNEGLTLRALCLPPKVVHVDDIPCSLSS